MKLSKRISRNLATYSKYEAQPRNIEMLAEIKPPGRIVLAICITRHDTALLRMIKLLKETPKWRVRVVTNSSDNTSSRCVIRIFVNPNERFIKMEDIRQKYDEMSEQNKASHIDADVISSGHEELLSEVGPTAISSNDESAKVGPIDIAYDKESDVEVIQISLKEKDERIEISSDEDWLCEICEEAIDFVYPACGHAAVHCANCINQLLRDSIIPDCPVCKRLLTVKPNIRKIKK